MSLTCSCLRMRARSLGCWSIGFALLLSFGCGSQNQPEAKTEAEPASAAPARPEAPANAEGKIEASPLAERVGGDGDALFEALDAKEIGVDFMHAWTRRAGQLRNNTTGCGVAMGDFDDDGLVDIFLPRSTDGGRLYRNLGGFKFEDVTEKAGVGGPDRWTTGATFADVNNDGLLDIYVCGYGCPSHLYINQGDGVFAEKAKEYGLDYFGSGVMMAFADYDRDGDLDGYLASNYMPPDQEIEYALVRDRRGVPRVPEKYLEFQDLIRLPDGSYGLIEVGQYDHLYRNNGDGTFTDVSEAAGIKGNDKGLSVTWWDYNNDGLPDIYVANDFYSPDRLYRNNGDGSFTDVAREAIPHMPWFSMGSDIGDINNDGVMDFMGTDMSASSHYRANVTMGDIQEDGWFLESSLPRQYVRNAVYLGTGTPRLFEAAYLLGLESTNWTWSIRFEDLDQDGLVDAHITNGMSRDWGNSDLKAKAMKQGPPNSDAYNKVFDDTPPLNEANFAYRNLGDLAFEDVSKQWGLDHNGVSFGAAMGDLDGDGDLDIVVNNFDEMASVYRNVGEEGRSVRVRLKGVLSNSWGIEAKVRIRIGESEQWRQLTLSRGFMSASDPTLHFGVGDASVIDELTVFWPSGHEQSFANLSTDQFYTITEPGRAPPEKPVKAEPQLFAATEVLAPLRHRETPYQEFDRQPLLPNRLSQLGPGMAVGDVNGDERDDLFLGGARGAAGWLLINQGGGEWAPSAELFPPWEQDSQCEDMAALFLDIDSDGDQDLYVVSGGVEHAPGDAALRDRLYLNDGDGKFVKAPEGAIPDFRDSGGAAVAADFDRDGDLDVFVGGRSVPGRYPESPKNRLLVNEGGKLTEASDDVLPPELRETGLVTGAVWSDLNGDGWSDLVVCHEWGPIRVFLNDEGRLRDATAEAGVEALLGWWQSVAAGDLDGDGDTDLVVGNIGLNTRYRVSPDRPARLFYGDFGGTGKQNIVAGYHDAQGRLVPARSKDILQQSLPGVAASHPTFHDYASASLAEIFSQESLDEALQRSANTAESIVLINDGSARFSASPLPRLAQVAPSIGLALLDFDADGRLDLYAVQNLFTPHRDTGRFDGGMSLLMRGRGDGSFDAVAPKESGLIVPGDGRSVVVTDINEDGVPDLIAAVNDDEVLAFCRSEHDRKPLAVVDLHGGDGNLTAIGARVSVNLGNGHTLVREVQGGGGFLSQQTARLYFGLGQESVKSIEVLWPSGQRTQHAADPAIREFKFSHPAASPSTDSVDPSEGKKPGV